MIKITSVEPQKKNPHRFNIYLDGQFAFGADEDLVVEHRLMVEKVLDTSDVEKLLFEAEVGKLMERMYRLFNIRARSEEEVRRYLKNLSFKRKIKDKEEISEAAIELLITKLKQKGLLSDEEFAKSWVEARRRSRKKGKIALKQELYQKGIDREIIEKVISEQGTGDSEEEVASQALEKKMKVWKSLPEDELNEKSLRDLKKKAWEFLLRRGFEYSVVKNVVANVLEKR